MDKIPFDPYDFFGYLASGLLALVGMDLVFGFPHILGQDFKIVESAVLLVGIYVAGQLVATPAKAILEDVLVGRVLRRPNVNLFLNKRPVIRSLIFPGFFTPLPEQTRKKVLAKAEREGVGGTGEDLFLHVRYNPTTLHDQKLMDKLNSFLNKYGFNRNLSFVSLVVGVALLVKVRVTPAPDPMLTRYGVLAVIAGILLLYRYLKFFRQYSYELFNTYGRSREDSKDHSGG